MPYQDGEFSDGFLNEEEEEGGNTDPSDEEFLEPEKEGEEEWEEE